MFKRISIVFLFIAIQNICFATMFIPLPLEKQVEEANIGVEVKLDDSRVFKNNAGMIMTEYSFEVLESYNLIDEDLENHRLKISMPGGTFEGITAVIDSAPQFAKDEKSFLLLKKIDSKIYLSNFTLGKFKIQNYNGRVYYISEVFPMDQKIGRIPKDKMIELMKEKWKISSSAPELSLPEDSKSVFALDLTPNVKMLDDFKRNPSQEEVKNNEGIPFFFWIAISIFVFFFALIFFKLGKGVAGHQHK